MATVQRRSIALVPAPGPAPSARGGAGALAAAVASLRTLVGDAAGSDRLLLEACRILTSTGVASAAWVLAPDGSSGELRRFASSGRVAAATAAQAWDAARATLDDGVARRLASRGGPDGPDATVAAVPLAGPHGTNGVLVLAAAGSPTTTPPDLQALEAVALAIGAAWSAADHIEEHERREAALREQTELLGQEVDRAVVGMALTSLEGRIVRANPAFCRMLGYSPEELALLTIDDLTPPAERSTPPQRGSGSQQADKRLVRRDGTVAWAVVSRGPILDLAGRPRYLCVQIQDLERQKSAEEEARRRADQHVAIALVGRRALSGLDLDTLFKDAAALVARALRVEIGSVLEPGADGKTLRLRAAHGVVDSLGGTIGPLGPQARYALSAGTPVVVEDLADDERFDPAAQLVAQGAVSGLSVAIASEGGHHAILGAHSRSRRSFGEEDVNFLEAVANVLAAAIERQRAETAIRHQATHDALTGLANRALLVEHLKMALARARRRRRSLAVVFCDLDRFKVVNDTLGHAAGDDLLRQVAARLTEVLRAEDTIARLGGDEFVAICEDLSGPDEAQMIVERLCLAMATAWTIEGQEVFAPASIGVVVAGGAATATAESLLADADVAMYTAKSRGRARWAMFSPSMRSGSAGRLEHEAALRRALERNELRLFYEPVVDLVEGRIVGAEALLRWQHPALGLVAPAEFIPLAEETGLIVPIGYWTFAEASRQAAAWNRALAADGRRLAVSVNLSARQLADPGLVEAVLAAAAAAGIEPGALSLEITETFLVEDPEAAAAVLEELKSHGVGLAVDDFGTGYSSLAYLKRFPVDRVKIDRSFVSGLSPAPEDTAIVAAMVGLAKSLGLRSVAEGVETPEQLAQLRELGCDEAQGYLMSRPKPAEVFGALLKSDPRW